MESGHRGTTAKADGGQWQDAQPNSIPGDRRPCPGSQQLLYDPGQTIGSTLPIIGSQGLGGSRRVPWVAQTEPQLNPTGRVRYFSLLVPGRKNEWPELSDLMIIFRRIFKNHRRFPMLSVGSIKTTHRQGKENVSVGHI